MGWNIAKEALESALKVLCTVSARRAISSSEYIKIEKHNDTTARLSLSADMSGCVFLVAIPGCPIKEPVYIDRKMLEPFIAAGKDLSPEYYVLDVKGAQIKLKHGPRTSTYTSNKQSHGYNKIPKLASKPHRISEDLSTVLDCAAHIAVDDPIVPHLACVYIYPKGGRLLVLSANAYQFFLGNISLPKHFNLKNAALPMPLIAAMNVENKIKLFYTDKLAMLNFSCGNLWHPVKTEASKKFPRKTIEDMIQKGIDGETLLRIDADALYDSAARARDYMSGVSSEESSFKIETKKGDSEIRIRCKAVGAEFCEQIKLPKASKGDVEIEWPTLGILPILDYCRKDGVARISRDAEGRTCFSAGHIAMLIAKREKPKSKKSKSKKEKKEAK